LETIGPKPRPCPGHACGAEGSAAAVCRARQSGRRDGAGDQDVSIWIRAAAALLADPGIGSLAMLAARRTEAGDG
jgi:hypothetical protein